LFLPLAANGLLFVGYSISTATRDRRLAVFNGIFFDPAV